MKFHFGKQKLLKQLTLIAITIYLPLQSMAWGMIGHRVVGEIAESHLSRKAKKEIKKILGDESLAMASNYADFIKSDTAYKYLNIWHYINFDDGMTLATMKAHLDTTKEVNAYTKINFLAGELKKNDLPQDKKVLYLRLLIHLVGDIHQPMHAAKKGNSGGNDVKVIWFNTPSNLHRVWDENLVEYQQLSYTEFANVINHTSKEQKAIWQNAPMSQWLFESYTISQQLNAEIKTPDQKLGFAYDYKHHNTLNEQLLKGGIRLAGLLNSIFD